MEFTRTDALHSRRKSHRRRRSRSVTILAWLELAQGLGTLAVGMGYTLAAGSILGGIPNPVPFMPIGDPVVTFEKGIGLLVLGLPMLWAAFGIFRLRPGAWLLAMLLQALTQAFAVVNYFRGHPNYLQMILSIVIVLYLNNEEVQEAFKRKPLEVLEEAE